MDKNIPFALASDFNPGSSPNGNMNLVNSLACIKMKILPEAVVNASTINGAYAMEISRFNRFYNCWQTSQLNNNKTH